MKTKCAPGIKIIFIMIYVIIFKIKITLYLSVRKVNIIFIITKSIYNDYCNIMDAKTICILKELTDDEELFEFVIFHPRIFKKKKTIRNRPDNFIMRTIKKFFVRFSSI